MKSNSAKVLAVLTIGVLLLTGCSTSTKKIEDFTDAEIAKIVAPANEFVERELDKISTLKFKYAFELRLLHSAFDAQSSSLGPEYENATWIPTTKPVSQNCEVYGDSRDSTIMCELDYGDIGYCDLRVQPVNDQKTFTDGKRGLPEVVDDYYLPVGLPKYFIKCRYLKDFPEEKDVIFIREPEAVKASVEEISRALMSYGGCYQYPDYFEIRNIRNYSTKFVRHYMVVSTNVEAQAGVGGDAMSYFDLWMWPQFDRYELRGGLGWDTYFRCKIDSDGNPIPISASGQTLNAKLR